MLTCFCHDNNQKTINIKPLRCDQFNSWLLQQSPQVIHWLKTNNFKGKTDTFCIIPDFYSGGIAEIIFTIEQADQFWPFGLLSNLLPPKLYYLDPQDDFFENIEQWQRACLAWGLGLYKTNPTKKHKKTAKLVLPDNTDSNEINEWVKSIYWIRDLINKPANELTPSALATEAMKLREEFNAEVNVTSGQDLLNNFPAITAVGAASNNPACLIDINWGDKSLPSLTLVGKGVCFDTGGLNLKNGVGMRTMKKDMGGAAQVLGLARMIMQQQLPVNLRVIIPALENSVSGNSYRPGDILNTRKGLRVEITNTDAEGRLALCEALTLAQENPVDLLIDMATLTGAARVALGTEVPVFFCNDDSLAYDLFQQANQHRDYIWRLPLFPPYKRYLRSEVADFTNASSTEYGGAITAALYLQHFVEPETSWVHFDIMAWNEQTMPGRPIGGEAMAIRGIFAYLCQRYKK